MMKELFDVQYIVFSLWGYGMSFLELLATVSGAVAVWLSAKENVWSWVLGILNVGLAFFMFYQVQLYPDMLLQVFFFITNIIGFWQWKFPKPHEANAKNQLRISKTGTRALLIVVSVGLVGTVLLGTFAKNLHALFPKIFQLPSAFPYMDSFTTVMSVVATFMLIRKKVEAWWVWMVVDVIATYMYYTKGVKLYALLYLLFVIIAAFGALEWTRTYFRQKENLA